MSFRLPAAGAPPPPQERRGSQSPYLGAPNRRSALAGPREVGTPAGRTQPALHACVTGLATGRSPDGGHCLIQAGRDHAMWPATPTQFFAPSRSLIAASSASQGSMALRLDGWPHSKQLCSGSLASPTGSRLSRPAWRAADAHEVDAFLVRLLLAKCSSSPMRSLWMVPQESSLVPDACPLCAAGT